MPDIFNASKQSEKKVTPPVDPILQPVDTEDTAVSEFLDSGTPSADSTQKNKRCVDDYSEVMRVEHATSNPLNAFAPKPTNIFFDSQQENEEVILLLRQHPVTQVRWILIAIGLIIFPFIFSIIPFFDFFPIRYQLVGLLGWYLLVTGFILQSFLTWFFNVYIITDERVIDVDFYNLIHKNVSTAKIDNVEDVTTVSGGTLQTIFDYGTVIIQTAGSQQQIEFDLIPQPAKVTKLLNELLLEEEREQIEGRVQ